MGSVQIDSDHDYTLQGEARRIFEGMVHDPRLHLPEEGKKLASTVNFIGEKTKPFFPVPYKCAETSAALIAYIGVLASTRSRDRYGLDQDIQVDV